MRNIQNPYNKKNINNQREEPKSCPILQNVEKILHSKIKFCLKDKEDKSCPILQNVGKSFIEDKFCLKDKEDKSFPKEKQTKSIFRTKFLDWYERNNEILSYLTFS